MKHILLTLIFTLALALPLHAVDITYQVNSGAKSASLTNSYDMNEASTASSDVDLRSNPSITSQTTVHAVGEENNIEITTSAHDGTSSSSASVRILDNVGSAQISTSASAANSTTALVTATGTGAQAGLIKGQSQGTKKFCAFTGDFNASSDTGNGTVSVSSNYKNPLSNIYIVTENPTTTHCPGIATTYEDTIQDGLDKATNQSGKPDYVFVDYGTHTGAKMVGKNSLTLMGVWGADNTIVTGSGGGGDVVSASYSTNLTIEGLTVTGGSKGGPVSPNGLGYYGTGSGIGIYNSANLRSRDNTAIGNDGAGIFVGSLMNSTPNITEPNGGSDHVEITGNTANNNGVAGIAVASVAIINPVSAIKGIGNDEPSEETVNVKGNTVNNNGLIGIGVLSSGDVNVSCNTVSNSELAGIAAGSLSGNVNVSQNTVNEGGAVGVGAVAIDGNATISGNNVSNSDVAGIAVGSSGNGNVSGNSVNGGLVGIGVLSGGGSNVNNNNVSDTDLAGIAVGSSGNANVSGNTVTNGGLIGMLALSANDANVTGNNVSNSDLAGIAVGSLGNANVSGNTVTNGGFIGIGVLSGGEVNINGNSVSENGVGVLMLGFSGTANVNENNIYSNTTGLENATSGPVDATNNWWGPGGTGGPGQGGNNGIVNMGAGSTTNASTWSHVRF
jgi:parallel beta-helix repeat protein